MQAKPKSNATDISTPEAKHPNSSTPQAQPKAKAKATSKPKSASNSKGKPKAKANPKSSSIAKSKPKATAKPKSSSTSPTAKAKPKRSYTSPSPQKNSLCKRLFGSPGGEDSGCLEQGAGVETVPEAAVGANVQVAEAAGGAKVQEAAGVEGRYVRRAGTRRPVARPKAPSAPEGVVEEGPKFSISDLVNLASSKGPVAPTAAGRLLDAAASCAKAADRLEAGLFEAEAKGAELGGADAEGDGEAEQLAESVGSAQCFLRL